MTFLTDAEITAMRTQIGVTLTDTCVIQAVTNTSDGAGGVTPLWAAVTGGTVACRVDHMPMRGQQEVIAGAEALIADFYLILPYDAPVAANRRVIHNGSTYEIRTIADDGSILLLKKCRIARID